MTAFKVGEQVAVVSPRDGRFFRSAVVERLTPKLLVLDDGSRWRRSGAAISDTRDAKVEPMSPKHVLALQAKIRRAQKAREYRENEAAARKLFLQRVEATRAFLVELARTAKDPDEEKFAVEFCDSAIRGWEYQP